MGTVDISNEPDRYQVRADAHLQRQVVEIRERMNSAFSAHRVTNSDIIRSLIADQRLHTLTLKDLMAARMSLTAELATRLHEMGCFDSEEIVQFVKAFDAAVIQAT